jgi:hypothetical protein
MDIAGYCLSLLMHTLAFVLVTPKHIMEEISTYQVLECMILHDLLQT